MNPDRARMPAIRRVILSVPEQKALAWLLRASDNGAIIAGSETSTTACLGDLAARLGRTVPARLHPRLRESRQKS